MKLRIALLFSLLSLVIFESCNTKENVYADTIFINGTIYTADSSNTIVEAVAVKNKRILDRGTTNAISEYKNESTQVIDLHGKTMTPGFIEGHGHLMKLGRYKINVELLDTKSYDEVLEKVKEAVKNAKPGEWIYGRGWHQSKWENNEEEMIQGFPTHKRLSEISPDNPIYLKHASGHATLLNENAMKSLGFMVLSKESMVDFNVEGGEIIRDELGNPTGIFNENAVDLVNEKMPELSIERERKAFDVAVQECYKNGITSFHDADAYPKDIELYQQLEKENKIGVRIYAFVHGEKQEVLDMWYEHGPIIDTVNHRLTVRSMKLYSDGALGSRGAWLLDEYSDSEGNFGMFTTPMEKVLANAKKGLEKGFQICTHAIGDRANREVLDRYEMAFEGNESAAKDARYRIEHAQHISPEDIPRFGKLGVIPAMQAIHMSSDRPWAIDRLGEKRIVESAYMWRSLIDSGAIIVNGTDVPVEPIDPLACFYASVTRRTLEGKPEGGYEPEQKMTREEALRSYTINPAYASFQENVLGSIEVGKIADFTVFDKDLMTIPEDDILRTKVVMTILDGEIVYKKDE